MIWWTLAVAGLFGLLFFALSLCVTIALVAREELDEAALGTVVAALTVSLSCCYVMLLPLEVALLRESTSYAIYTEWMWPATLLACLFCACVLIPFSMIRYESLEPEREDAVVVVAGETLGEPRSNPTRKAALATAVIDFTLVALFFLLWLAFGAVEEPSEHGKNTHTQRVPLTAFLVALTTAAGWMVFFVFCGVGLAAVPIEGIRSFLNRPRPYSAAEYEVARARVNTATTRLLEQGRALDVEIGSGNPNRSQRRRLAAFREQVRELEATHAAAEAAFAIGNTSVIRQYLMLGMSVVGVLLSVAWVLHMILCNLAHTHAFLNNVLLILDELLPLLGTGVYAVMAFYLVWCTVLGCMTVGGNLLAFPVFPMRRGATTTTALLFNALLTTIASMAALHLCATSFDAYAKNTSVTLIFTRYLDHIAGVASIVHYLPYALVVLSMVSVLWLLLCPKRRRALDDESDEENPLF